MTKEFRKILEEAVQTAKDDWALNVFESEISNARALGSVRSLVDVLSTIDELETYAEDYNED